nr:unnamed protein product [Callosobruchus chinensis]
MGKSKYDMPAMVSHNANTPVYLPRSHDINESKTSEHHVIKVNAMLEREGACTDIQEYLQEGNASAPIVESVIIALFKIVIYKPNRVFLKKITEDQRYPYQIWTWCGIDLYYVQLTVQFAKWPFLLLMESSTCLISRSSQSLFIYESIVSDSCYDNHGAVIAHHSCDPSSKMIMMRLDSISVHLSPLRCINYDLNQLKKTERECAQVSGSKNKNDNAIAESEKTRIKEGNSNMRERLRSLKQKIISQKSHFK